jgi:hypothetical protein
VLTWWGENNMGGKQVLTCHNGKCVYLFEGAADWILFPDKLGGGGGDSGEYFHRKPKPN